MHALAKFGLATVLVTLAVLSNVLVTLSLRRPRSNSGASAGGPLLANVLGSGVRNDSRISRRHLLGPGRKGGEGNWTALQQCRRALLADHLHPRERGRRHPGELPEEQFARRALRSGLRAGHATFFAISSTQQGLIFYSRCNFSTDAGGAIHCLDLVYPQAEKRAWDDVVTRISRSLRPLEG
jgi:hypothetical protein